MSTEAKTSPIMIKNTANINLTKFDEFLKTKKSKHINSSGEHIVGDNFTAMSIKRVKSDMFMIDISGTELKFQRLEAILMYFKEKPHIILNGDDQFININDYCKFQNVSTMSLICIEHMFNFKKKSQILKHLISGKIKILDSNGDKFINKTKCNKSPGLGFSLIFRGTKRVWHKAGNTCFKDEKNNFYIMGQDEGSYFCSQLPKIQKKTLTCEEALKLLAPKESKTSSLRQGEWFFIEVSEKKVPKIHECIAFGKYTNNADEDYSSRICLPVESDDSNAHILDGEIRINKNGEIFVKNFELYHIDHKTLYSPAEKKKQWYKIVRNNAVRSVSVQGVD